MIWRENLKLDDKCKYCSHLMKEHICLTMKDFEHDTDRKLRVCDMIGSLEGQYNLKLLCILPEGKVTEAEDPCDTDYLENISTEGSK